VDRSKIKDQRQKIGHSVCYGRKDRTEHFFKPVSALIGQLQSLVLVFNGFFPFPQFP